MIYIGIDPGLSGAVAILMPEDMSGSSRDIYIHDTPVVLVEGKRKYMPGAMAQLLEPYRDRQDVVVTLEAVHSMPKQGVASSFGFGEGFGIWKGIVAAYKLWLELPSPQRWKKEMLPDMGKDKGASRLRATQLFPGVAHLLSRVKDDGRAEALLLAEYGRRKNTGDNNG